MVLLFVLLTGIFSLLLLKDNHFEFISIMINDVYGTNYNIKVKPVLFFF